MSISERIYQADQAKLVLENEAFQQAFEDIKQEITEQWMQSPARDQDARERLWLMLKMLEKVKLTLQSTLDSGKLARIEMDHQKSMAQRAKEWLGAS